MFILLLILWIIFYETISLKVVLTGAIISGALYAFSCRFLGYGPKRELLVVRHIGAILGYLLFLVKEIISSNMNVARMILSRKEPEPALVQFKVHLKHDTSKTLLANSITLTPGTITVEQNDDEYVIHALDVSFGEDINESEMYERVHGLEQDMFGKE